MRNHFRISNVVLEGFRGFNERFAMNLGGESVVIFGPNGTGKTSLLQGIEWALFGQIPQMEGAEFEREDAIVNQFSQEGVAKAGIILTDGGRVIRVLRTRKRQKTTRPRSELEMEIDGERYEGEQAERKLQSTLGVSQEEFYAAVYLHQEAIRSFVLSKPPERSEVIDRMLGTYRLRELIDSLPVAAVQYRRRDLENAVERIRGSVTTEIPGLRERLESEKAELYRRGFSEEMLNITYMGKLFRDITSKLRETARTLGTTLKEFEEPSQDVPSLREAISKLRREATFLEQERFDSYRDTIKTGGELKALKERRIEISKKLGALGEVDRDAIYRDIQETRSSLRNKEVEISSLRNQRDNLHKQLITLRQLTSSLREAQQELDSLVKEATEESLQGSVKRAEGQIKELEEEMKKSQALAQLAATLLDYITIYRPQKCPACGRAIEHSLLEAHLRSELQQSRDSAGLLELKERLNKMKAEMRIAEERLLAINEAKRRAEKARQELERAKVQISETLGTETPDIDVLEAKAAEYDLTIRRLEEEVTSLRRKEASLQEKAKTVGDAIEALREIDQEIKERLKTDAQNEALQAELDKALADAEAKLASIQEASIQLGEANEIVARYEALLSYHTTREDLARLEFGLPERERELRELEKRLKQVRELEEGLEDIRQAGLSEQRSLVESTLSTVQNTINQYYSRILGHPYYGRIEITTETVREKNIYWIKAHSESHTTYIQTRLSSAQLNATALAIFLTMAKRLPHNLGLVILDDPTQSMDTAHKEALAKILGEKMQERQIIVATPDQELLALLKDACPAQTQFFTLKGWRTEGPILNK